MNYKAQRDVLRKLLDSALCCAPELLRMPVGEKILIALNALNADDTANISTKGRAKPC